MADARSAVAASGQRGGGGGGRPRMRAVHKYSNEARMHEFCSMMPGIAFESANLRRAREWLRLAFVYSCEFVDGLFYN